MVDFQLNSALLIDVAGDRRQLGHWYKGQLVDKVCDESKTGHVEFLPPMLERLPFRQRKEYERVELIAVTTGPGGYAALRAGIAYALGLGLAWDRPVIGISLLQIWAEEAFGLSEACQCLAVHDARRGECLTQHFTMNDEMIAGSVQRQNFVQAERSLGGVQPLTSAPTRSQKDWVVIGSGAAYLNEPNWLSIERHHADLEAFGRCVARLDKGEYPTPTPLYVRPPDAMPPRNFLR